MSVFYSDTISALIKEESRPASGDIHRREFVCAPTGKKRSGEWSGKHGTRFAHLPEITRPVEAASDQAALRVDFQ